MAGPKSTHTRIVGIITDEMHPYILVSKTYRDASHLLFISPLLLLVYFLALPSLLSSLIYLVTVAFYTYLC